MADTYNDHRIFDPHAPLVTDEITPPLAVKTAQQAHESLLRAIIAKFGNPAHLEALLAEFLQLAGPIATEILAPKSENPD